VIGNRFVAFVNGTKAVTGLLELAMTMGIVEVASLAAQGSTN
jgi:hypothetical protein